VCSQSSGGHDGHREKPGTSSATQSRSLSACDSCLLVLKAEQQPANTFSPDFKTACTLHTRFHDAQFRRGELPAL
jgi:hypothetical protein